MKIKLIFLFATTFFSVNILCAQKQVLKEIERAMLAKRPFGQYYTVQTNIDGDKFKTPGGYIITNIKRASRTFCDDEIITIVGFDFLPISEMEKYNSELQIVEARRREEQRIRNEQTTVAGGLVLMGVAVLAAAAWEGFKSIDWSSKTPNDEPCYELLEERETKAICVENYHYKVIEFKCIKGRGEGKEYSLCWWPGSGNIVTCNYAKGYYYDVRYSSAPSNHIYKDVKNVKEAICYVCNL